ncbi:Sec-independent protein translocase subunit TatA [Promicromonospora sukumoe]|jgi:sec-independent protein translocase protein TatA|uniref:Sec-independent protein translocase subunit TatA n=1 Tax=Promicromonospora sukumoe TaxID=88382 RepID=UPI0003762DB8|nr:Sec-independent protein translocase subunit TatA [Promicromonospora sukumoe]
MGAMQPWHWIVLLVVVLLLFGSSRLPGLAKSVGQSMKIFKKEVKDLRDDRNEDGNAADNAPGAATNSSTTGTGTGSGTGSTPGLIDHKDRDIPKA